MFDTVYNWTLSVPDLVILLGFSIAFGLAGTAVSYLSYILFFGRRQELGEPEKKVADGVHNSILALIAFFMALVTSNELTSFADARGQVRLEGLAISRLDRDLLSAGLAGDKARTKLHEYVSEVVGDEWTRLARRPQSLSPSAGDHLIDLWGEIRRVQQAVQSSNASLSEDIITSIKMIEEARAKRLSAAVNSIPDVVWIILGVLFLAACVLNGRNRMTRESGAFAFVHMSAFGLMVALNIIIDNPFGGDTSISPLKIERALR